MARSKTTTTNARRPRPADDAAEPVGGGDARRLPPAWHRAWAPLVLIAAAVLAYHNSFTGGFIFDDVVNVRNNFQLRHLWPIWQTMWGPLGTGVAGRPVVQLSFAINYALHGLDVTGYHVTNLTLHIVTGLVFYGVLRRTLISPKLQPRFGRDANLLAFLG